MKLSLPTKKGTPNSNPEIEFNQLVVIGANGSGKTRFGSEIEEKYIGQTHRISAQKSLSFSSEVSPKSKNRAEKEFFYGFYNEEIDAQLMLEKKNLRWGGKMNTHLLNDFEKLLILLHSEEYEESLNFKEGRILKPTTKLDLVQVLWEKVLPHRKLKKSAGVIETYPTGDDLSIYNASEMSDGERVIFYLAGEVVCVPENSIIIIDEPEMHIHKSLIKNLFDLIENERPDCTFVYLTHDIDFAFSRQNAKKIWAKSYEENKIWDYEILDENIPIPEQLYLEVLGSRKPIIFIEGDNSSIDYKIYEQVYSCYTIKPIGSCEKVIQSVKSFNEQQVFHHIKSFGIIDRDRRQDSDIEKLYKDIWVLDVAEVENLLLIEIIVKSLATHLGRDPDHVFEEVKKNVITFFKKCLDSQILIHFRESLKKDLLSLGNFSSKIISETKDEIDELYNNIDMNEKFESIKTKFESVVLANDYDSILKFFNLKGALIPESKVCELTGINNKNAYLNLVLTLLKKKDAVAYEISSGIESKILKK